MICHDPQVEEHTDRDEKQPEEDVPEWLDILFDLMAVFGFRNQHAAQKRAQCKRQAGQFRQPRQPQDNEQHIEHE